MNNQYIGNSLFEDILTLLDLPENSELDLVSLPAEKQQDESISANMKTALEIINFMDEMPGGFLIYYAERDEKIIYANKALYRLFGCSSFRDFQELTGNSFRGIVHPEDLDRVEMSIWEQIAESQYDFDYVEYRIIRKDGTIGWVEDYGHFIKRGSADGIFYVFIGDATEKHHRQQMERNALLNAQKLESEKLQNIIDDYDKEKKLINQEHLRRLEVIDGLSVNYDTILYANLDTDKVLPYRLSDRIARQFDYEHKPCEFLQFVSDYADTWVHPDDCQRVVDAVSPDYIREKLADNKAYYVNYRVFSENITQFLQLRVIDVGNGNHISQIVMGIRRIDEEILQEMEQKQILEDALNRANAAVAAKNTFLSNMSHDMRTPLNAIFGFISLAKSNMDNRQLIQSYLDRMEESSHQLLEQIEKVLEIAWMESGDVHFSETKCNLIDIARELYDSFRSKIMDKNISFSLEYAELKHPYVYSDPDKLRKLIKYLINNAIKYNRNNGRVRFTLKESEENLGEYSLYQIVIQDNGIGISEDFLEHIFEPFEREKNTTYSQTFGVGLGLTIVKSIVDGMGGDIEVSSAVDKGSTFTVTLHLRIQEDSCTNEDSEDDFYVNLPGKRILLVEDNEINLEIETEILQEIGFVIETATDGSIAVDKLKHAAPGYFSLVLMDIQMPVMDGYEASKAIRKLEDPVLSQIPIIALSANVFESDKQMSLESGMNGHLAKPIDIPLLLSTISNIFKSTES
ncbi:MAG: ATP-binding protein [Lachnospiraceae bacterium]